MSQINQAILKLAQTNPEFRNALIKELKTADKWETKPKGWTDESRKKFWETLTSAAPKHKVTECIKRMGKHMDDPGAFCASLADRVTPGWRQEAAKEKAASSFHLTPVPGRLDSQTQKLLNRWMSQFPQVDEALLAALAKVHHQKDLMMLKAPDAVKELCHLLGYEGNTTLPAWIKQLGAQLRVNSQREFEAGRADASARTASAAQPLSLRRDYGTVADEWLDIEEVATLCPPCAAKMARNNIRRVRASVLRTVTKLAAGKWWAHALGGTRLSIGPFGSAQATKRYLLDRKQDHGPFKRDFGGFVGENFAIDTTPPKPNRQVSTPVG